MCVLLFTSTVACHKCCISSLRLNILSSASNPKLITYDGCLGIGRLTSLLMANFLYSAHACVLRAHGVEWCSLLIFSMLDTLDIDGCCSCCDYDC